MLLYPVFLHNYEVGIKYIPKRRQRAISPKTRLFLIGGSCAVGYGHTLLSDFLTDFVLP